MSFNKIEKTIEILQIGSRGIGYKKDSDGFIISKNNAELDLLLLPNTLAPVFTGMADVLHRIIFDDKDFKGLFPTQIKKSSEGLCYASLVERDDYKIEDTGYSLLTSHLFITDIMGKILMRNDQGKVELTHLINLWRSELGHYKEGEIINLENHKKLLFDGNFTKFPKIRQDLQEQRKSSIRKNIFK